MKVLGDRDGRPPLTSLLGWEPARGLAELVEDLAAQALRLDVRDLFFELMNRTRYLEALTADLEASEGARCAANVSRFAELGLVDTVEVGVIPVLLGEGVPLLPPPAKRVALKLISHKLYAKTGIVSLEYAVSYGRKPKRRR